MKNRLREIRKKPYQSGGGAHPFPTHPLYVQGLKLRFFLFSYVHYAKKKIASPAGNRIPVFRVTGGDTHRYTTEDFDSYEMRFIKKQKQKQKSRSFCLLPEFDCTRLMLCDWAVV